MTRTANESDVVAEIESHNIKNAVIESTKIDIGERGCLTAWVILDYGGAGQGFGGYALYVPEDWEHHAVLSPAGHFITRVMQIAGVGQWDELVGKAVRVDATLGGVNGIGHILKNDWFYPATDFQKVRDVE